MNALTDGPRRARAPGWLALVLVLAVGACASIKVEVDDSRAKEVAARKTFAWAPAGDTKDSKLMPVLQQIRTNIERGLIEKGYTKAAPEAAAFHIAVAVQIGLESITTMSRDNMIEEAWWAGGTGMGTSFSARTSEVTTEVNAKLALIAGEPDLKGQPLWRGRASFTVTLENPEPQKGVEAADKLVSSFPKPKAAN